MILLEDNNSKTNFDFELFLYVFVKRNIFVKKRAVFFK